MRNTAAGCPATPGPRSSPHARRCSSPTLLGDPALITAATGALAFYAGASGRRDVEFGEEDLARLVPLPRPALWQITPAISVGALLLWAGELDRARAVLSREHEELVRQGRLLRLALVLLVLLADVEWRAGRWAEAEAYAEEAKSILDDALPGGAVVVYYHHVLLAGSSGPDRRGSPACSRGVAPHGAPQRSPQSHAHPLGARPCRARWRGPGGCPAIARELAAGARHVRHRRARLATDSPGRDRGAGGGGPSRRGRGCAPAARAAGGRPRPPLGDAGSSTVSLPVAARARAVRRGSSRRR